MLAVVGMKVANTGKNTKNQDEREKHVKGIEHIWITN